MLKKMAEIASVNYLANPLLSLGRFFSKVYSHRLALVFTPSLSTILKMMSALMGTWGGINLLPMELGNILTREYSDDQTRTLDSSRRKDFHLTVAILVEKEGNKAFACFFLSVGVDSHEPVCLPVLGPDAEHP